MTTSGGSAQPVALDPTATQQGGAAIPVVVVPDGYPLIGGPAQAVYEVTSGIVQGGPALPVYAAASGAPVVGGNAIPVYVVSGTLGGDPPVNTVLPVVSGNAVTGQTLSTTDGTWTGTAPIVYTYQWKRGGVDIGGATNTTYLLTDTDNGTTITVTVTATNAVGSASATSAGTAVQAFLLLDRFTTADPAPITSPRTCEPGPGTLTFTDTLNTLDISGGEVVPNARTTGLRDPWIREAGGYARTIGRIFMVQIKRIVPALAVDANEPMIGWVTTLTTPTENQSYAVIFNITLGGGFLPVTLGSFGTAVDPVANNTFYTIGIMHRNPGYMVFIDSKLAFVSATGAEATLFASIMARAANRSPGQFDNARVLDLPAPFNTQYGLATVRTAIAIVGDTITPASADANIEGTWTAVTGQTWNLYVRRTDDSNTYVVRCSQSGSTIKWIEINGGVETEKSSVAQTFNNGTTYRLFISLQGSLVTTAINNVVKNVRSDATYNQTVIGAKTDRALTDFIAWPRSVPALAPF